MSKQRIAVSLDAETVVRLDRLNAHRFGGVYQGKSIVVGFPAQAYEMLRMDDGSIRLSGRSAGT